VIYLLHFDRPVSGLAGHYLGYADVLGPRLQRHADGLGSVLTRAAREQGITFQLARTWQGDRRTERRMKGRPRGSNHVYRYCPICKPLHGINRWAGGGQRISTKIVDYQANRAR
jgi:hypothetical protein